MKRAILRNLVFFGGLLATGYVCSLATTALTSGRGAHGPTIFHAQQPAWALVVVMACLAAAALVAGFVGRVTNAAIGMFVLGFGVFVLAGRTETVSEIAFSGGGSARVALGMLALETVV